VRSERRLRDNVGARKDREPLLRGGQKADIAQLKNEMKAMEKEGKEAYAQQKEEIARKRDLPRR
jgi:hypothetical protein